MVYMTANFIRLFQGFSGTLRCTIVETRGVSDNFIKWKKMDFGASGRQDKLLVWPLSVTTMLSRQCYIDVSERCNMKFYAANVHMHYSWVNSPQIQLWRCVAEINI